jgi:hypothetical protein
MWNDDILGHFFLAFVSVLDIPVPGYAAFFISFHYIVYAESLSYKQVLIVFVHGGKSFGGA